jgi:hypothetical protein
MKSENVMATILQTQCARLVRNLARLPSRTVRTLQRRLDPVYQLERQADREIPRRFGRERMQLLEAIPGTSSARECRLLAYLAMQSPPGGALVEIGAFKGKSTVWLVEAAEHHVSPPPVVSIDPHLGANWHPDPTWVDFSNTVTRFRLDDRGLQVRRARSHEVGAFWDRPIAFLWIDGSHAYDDVVTDIEDFTPYILPDGWVVFDDAASSKWPDVWRAIEARMLNRPGFQCIGIIRNVALFRREPSKDHRS